jgi:uncharacterized protein
MTSDDLNAPLGLDRVPRPGRARLAVHIMAGLLGAIILLFAAWALLGNDPLGGEPTATVRANLSGSAERDAQGKAPGDAQGRAPGSTKSQARPPPSRERSGAPRSQFDTAAEEPQGEGAEKSSGDGERIVTIIDGKSGARQQVRIPAADAVSPVNEVLLEMTRNGAVPRVGADGRRPAQVYAQPVVSKSDLPQIAIVITGIGISASAAAQALNNLPGPVSLALTPYGADLDRIAAKAHDLGHELLLQVPMEPLDYPDNDPGPQTLLTSLTDEQNIDRLQWAMSRVHGFIGIVNLMGGRFTASERAFAPLLREIGRRGLIYMDDGTAPRSLATQLAGASSLPFARSDLVLDSVPSPGEIDRALGKLEAVAREQGTAVGVAGALPVSIERIVH